MKLLVQGPYGLEVGSQSVFSGEVYKNMKKYYFTLIPNWEHIYELPSLGSYIYILISYSVCDAMCVCVCVCSCFLEELING